MTPVLSAYKTVATRANEPIVINHFLADVLNGL